MATLIVCPRCRGAVQADAHACPRCGLVLSGLGIQGQESASSSGSTGYDIRPSYNELPPNYTSASAAGAPTVASATPYSQGPLTAPLSGQPARPTGQQGGYISGGVAPNSSTNGARSSVDPGPDMDAAGARIVPRGAIELLPEESVVFQLGALYLTNKRVILLAPTVVRAAFLRDVDAVGTLTERASGWSLFFGLVFLALSGAGIYFSIAHAQFEDALPLLYQVDPLYIGIALGVLGLILLLMY
ncbi:MAG TPA: hypothetical protein VLQ48_03030, partial [Chloroflexia bacterium]|nr:hypothetical protein [Chloroflexia bacterium]